MSERTNQISHAELEQLAERWQQEYTELYGEDPSHLKSHAKEFWEAVTGKAVIFLCEKVRYGHKDTAEKAAKSMSDKTGDSFDCYQCLWCDGAWHIGHSRTRGN